MDIFNLDLDWAILATPDCPAAEELALGIMHLRSLTGLAPKRPPILDATGPAPEAERPIFVVNCEMDHPEGPEGVLQGFAWRTGIDRVELYGDSRHGLMNGIGNFLQSLGLFWPKPGENAILSPSVSPLEKGKIPLALRNQRRESGPSRKAFALPIAICARWGRTEGVRYGVEILEWAARIGFDAVLVLTDDRAFGIKKPGLLANSDALWEKIAPQMGHTARRLGISLEKGGRCMNRFVPRKRFSHKKDWNRMVNGKRRADFNFCPTNPDALAAVASLALERILKFPDADVFHIHGSGSDFDQWCQCPSCRAFSPPEQELLALNAIADRLLEAGLNTTLALPEHLDESTNSGAIKPSVLVKSRPVQLIAEDAAGFEAVIKQALKL